MDINGTFLYKLLQMLSYGGDINILERLKENVKEILGKLDEIAIGIWRNEENTKIMTQTRRKRNKTKYGNK